MDGQNDLAEWGVVSAADTGAPHLRERIWIVANAGGRRCVQSQERQMEQPRRAEIIGAGFDLANATSSRLAARGIGGGDSANGSLFDLLAVDGGQDVAYANGAASQRHASPILGAEAGMGGQGQHDGHHIERSATGGSSQRTGHGRPWPVEPGLGRVVDGVAHRVDRLRAIGNGQVSRVAATAWEILS